MQIRILLCVIWLLLLTGCLPNKKLTVAATATLLEGVAKSAFQQSDLKLVREGIPAYLMLMDGMIESVPDNEQLLINAAQTYSSFASAFMEETDPEYAKLLYRKARYYSLRSLEIRGFKDPAQSLFDDFGEDVKNCGKKDVPYLFWAATSWGNWIKLNLDSMEALAELPRVELMMKKVLELDEGFYYGGPHIFMGIWFASWPKDAGGDLKKAQKHFQKALQIGQGKFLMTYVYYANFYARQILDKDLFVSTLQKVLDAPVDILPEITLLNAVARKKAEDLLHHKEEIFE
ncbi:MAG: TRAP transporter TatT component family protein [Proteobacteria bacterium]|nr:TRAP transporter TatT component family protein [Pseudomonadota bacterium]